MTDCVDDPPLIRFVAGDKPVLLDVGGLLWDSLSGCGEFSELGTIGLRFVAGDDPVPAVGFLLSLT